MKKSKKILTMGLAALTALTMSISMTGCGNSDSSVSSVDGNSDNSKVYNIGICQLIQHEALDAATKGFKDTLTEKLGSKVKFLLLNKFRPKILFLFPSVTNTTSRFSNEIVSIRSLFS